MQKSNVHGKICKVINCMYQNIKTCIRKENEYSEFFNCEIGVKQGENVFPYLISLYLNDLEFFFGENNVSGLESISAKCLQQLGFYIKTFNILYADDTVIMSETEEGLQQALLNFEQYCDLWKLKVNAQKTKKIFSVNEDTKHKDRLNYTTRI